MKLQISLGLGNENIWDHLEHYTTKYTTKIYTKNIQLRYFNAETLHFISLNPMFPIMQLLHVI